MMFYTKWLSYPENLILLPPCLSQVTTYHLRGNTVFFFTWFQNQILFVNIFLVTFFVNFFQLMIKLNDQITSYRQHLA